jgi:hypothetical protein
VTGSDGQRVAQVPPDGANGGNQNHTQGEYRSLYPGFHNAFRLFTRKEGGSILTIYFKTKANSLRTSK